MPHGWRCVGDLSEERASHRNYWGLAPWVAPPRWSLLCSGSWAEVELTENRLDGLIHVVRRHRQTQVRGRRQGLLMDAECFPLLAVPAALTGVGVAGADQFQPYIRETDGEVRLRRERLRRIDALAGPVRRHPGLKFQAAVVLVAGLIIPEGEQHDMLGSFGEGSPEHDAGLRVDIGHRERIEADAQLEISGDLEVGEMKFIPRPPDIFASSDDSDVLRRLDQFAGQTRGSDVNAGKGWLIHNERYGGSTSRRSNHGRLMVVRSAADDCLNVSSRWWGGFTAGRI